MTALSVLQGDRMFEMMLCEKGSSLQNLQIPAVFFPEEQENLKSHEQLLDLKFPLIEFYVHRK